jgi:hypothetical protein
MEAIYLFATRLRLASFLPLILPTIADFFLKVWQELDLYGAHLFYNVVVTFSFFKPILE